MESINILCFGDSLTEGYTNGGISFTPYAKSMKSWLESAWPSTKINVDIDGSSGDMVDEHYGLFLTRIKDSCKLDFFSV
jgi:lysophospholipase L1-like esterase